MSRLIDPQLGAVLAQRAGGIDRGTALQEATNRLLSQNILGATARRIQAEGIAARIRQEARRQMLQRQFAAQQFAQNFFAQQQRAREQQSARELAQQQFEQLLPIRQQRAEAATTSAEASMLKAKQDAGEGELTPEQQVQRAIAENTLTGLNAETPEQRAEALSNARLLRSLRLGTDETEPNPAEAVLGKVQAQAISKAQSEEPEVADDTIEDFVSRNASAYAVLGKDAAQTAIETLSPFVTKKRRKEILQPLQNIVEGKPPPEFKPEPGLFRRVAEAFAKRGQKLAPRTLMDLAERGPGGAIMAGIQSLGGLFGGSDQAPPEPVRLNQVIVDNLMSLVQDRLRQEGISAEQRRRAQEELLNIQNGLSASDSFFSLPTRGVPMSFAEAEIRLNRLLDELGGSTQPRNPESP